MAGFNIKDIIANTFGFNPQVDEIEIDGSDSRIVNVKSDGKWYKSEPSGLYGYTVFMPVTVAGIFLPYCMVTISGGNKIVETDVTDRDGMVKEYIRADDLSIQIQGVLYTRDGTFPEEQAQEFKDLVRTRVAVEIDCPLTDIFLLTNETNAQDKVVVMDWKLTPQKGVEHVVPFELSLKTDREFELEVR